MEIYHGSDPDIFFPINKEINPNEVKFLSVRLLEKIYNIDVIIKHSQFTKILLTRTTS